MAVKLVAFLALLGFGIGAIKNPEMLLPASTLGRVLIGLVAVFAFALPVQVAYKLRSQLDDFLAIPESDRNLILELKTVAGEAVHHCTTLPSFSSKDQADESVQRLRNVYSRLRHYSGIYDASFQLSCALLGHSTARLTLKDFETMSGLVETIYRRVLDQCDAVLKPTKDHA